MGRVLRAVPWLMLAGIALLIYGQWQWIHRLDSVWPGAVPALAGLALLLVTARRWQPAWDIPVFRLAGESLVVLRRWQTLISVVGLALCVYSGVRAVQEDLIVWIILGLWAGGVALIAGGLISGPAWRRWKARVGASWRNERRTWVWLGVLFAVALAIRTVQLETIPYIMSGDDAQFAQEAVFLKGERGWLYNPFRMGFWHHPRIVHTLMAISIQLLGQTVAASRLPWAMLGALTIPATYLLARRLFGTRVGWGAAMILTTLPVHVFFSRISMDMTGDTFFLVLALALTVGAMRDNEPVEGALAGASLGLTQYFYFAGRIAPLIMGGMLLLYALYDWRKCWERWRTILVLAVVAAGVVFPGLYAVYADEERPLNPRLEHVGIWQTGDLRRAAKRGELRDYLIYQLQHSLLAYVQFEDESDVYGRYGPLLGWYTGVPFLVGLAVLVRRWREPRSGLLIGWVTGTALIGGAMLVDPPHFTRYVNALPAAATIAAVGLVWASDRVLDSVTRWKMVLSGDDRPQGIAWRFTLPVTMSLVLAGANQLVFSYGYLPKTHELLYGEPTRQLNEVVTILDSFEGRYAVWRFSSLELDMNATSLLRYLTPQNAGQEYEGDLADWREILRPGPTAFVMAPARLQETLPRLAILFPGGELQEYLNPRNGSPLVYVYLVDIVPWEEEPNGG